MYLKRCFTLLLIFTLYALPFTLDSSPTYAQSPTPAACDPATPGDCPAGLREIEEVFTNFISVIVALAFMISLLMLTTAGIKYLTSGGEPKAVQAAHSTFAWSLLGILFLAVSWLILILIEDFTGIRVTIFNIRALCNVGGTNWCGP